MEEIMRIRQEDKYISYNEQDFVEYYRILKHLSYIERFKSAIEKIAFKINKRRLDKILNLDDFKEVVSPNLLSKFEQDKSILDPDKLVGIANILNMPLCNLFPEEFVQIIGYHYRPDYRPIVKYSLHASTLFVIKDCKLYTNEPKLDDIWNILISDKITCSEILGALKTVRFVRDIKLTECSSKNISGILNGHINPTRKRIETICDEFGVSRLYPLLLFSDNFPDYEEKEFEVTFENFVHWDD